MGRLKLDDREHFAEMERRKDELRKMIPGAKAGFDPNQARDSSGRWTSGGSWHKIDIKEQTSSHHEFGGSTYDPKSGKSLAGAKGMGAVALTSDRSVVIDSNLTEEILTKYIEDNKDLLDGDGSYAVGTWWGGEPAQLWLDISEVLPIEEAKKLGAERNQIAIFDLENLEEVNTGGSGKFNKLVMTVKTGKKKKFAKFGKFLQATKPNKKPVTAQEFLNGKK